MNSTSYFGTMSAALLLSIRQKRLSEMYGCKIYLKREDLNHTGAHKINNTIGQILLARRMGKNPYHSRDGSRTARRGKPLPSVR